MHPTPWNLCVHEAAKRRASALRQQALDDAFQAVAQVLRRLVGTPRLPEA